MSLKEAVACIKRNKSFLITSHVNPEGDALGAELALYRILRKLGKSVVIVNEDNLPYGYEFLPGTDSIKKYKDNLKIDFDCFVALDCSDLKRTGEVYRLNSRKKTILNIDHHVSNRAFGTVNWIEPYASSCSEMIYRLHKKLRLEMDKETALSLYTGIVSDTGSFRYSNTASSTHRVAAELLRYNLDVAGVYRNVYENIPLADMKLLTRLLPEMRAAAGGKIIWFALRRGKLRDKRLSFDLAENLLTFARAVKGVQVAALFKENLGVRDEIRVNLRSQGKVDVNKIAQFFGGGGHKAASGITMRGSIESVRRQVLAKIKESL